MFTLSSDIYDLVYSFKDYGEEAGKIRKLISARTPNCHSVLDVGCGTAEHHRYLRHYYAVDGIDINPSFLEQAKTKNPEGRYTEADMVSFSLHRQYDAVLCLFSSIGYLKNYSDLASAFTCFNHHLAPNGLLIVEPWFTIENWEPGRMHMISTDEPGLKICRMATSRLEGEFSILEFEYLVGKPGRGIRHFSEEHRLRLTPKKEMMTALESTGFTVAYEEPGLAGRGLYFAHKLNSHISWKK